MKLVPRITLRRRVHRGAVLGLLVLAEVTLGFQPVRAVTITVNSTADNTIAQDANCTLREAIDNVNAADDTTGGDCTPGTGTGDSIVFDLSLPATITLTDSMLEIYADVTITGPTTGGLAVDGNSQVGVLEITDGTVSITNLTIQNGVGLEGGGVYNDGTLTLTNCTLSGNSSTDGGGLYNDIDGTAKLTNCTLTGNSAPNDFGGGGLYNDGSMTLTNCTLSGNSGFDGGGLYNDVDGVATLTNCTLSGNSTSGNDLGGGGVYSDGTLTFINCTLSGNSAATNDGGGLYNDIDGTATLTNTIVANSPSGSNCAGTGIEAGGHNLSSDATCAMSPDLLNTDPRLAPLANYGGPTATLALCTAAGIPDPSCTGPSPAIDAGDDSVGPLFNLTTDQRGLPRRVGLHVDIGAYEAQETIVPACVGDCDGSGKVTEDDLITMVNIALGNAPLSACPVDGAQGSGDITVSDIITAVNNALGLCPVSTVGPPPQG